MEIDAERLEHEERRERKIERGIELERGVEHRTTSAEPMHER